MISLSVAEWILLGTFAITAGSLIWRMAILHQQCISNKESLIRVHDRVDKLECNLTVKVDDFGTELRVVSERLIKIETQLDRIHMDMEKRQV